MKKIKNLLLPVFMVIAGVFGLNSINAATATTVGANTDTGAVKTLTITREVENVSNPVTGTFTYSVTADPNNPTGFDSTTLPSNLVIQFNNVAPDANQVATQTGTLDLSALRFTKVGDYKFIIEEVSVTNANNNYPKDTTEYYAYVSVRNIVDTNTREISGNLKATLASQVKEDDAGNKTDSLFESSLETTYITLSKTITGERADDEQYFEFTLSIPGNTGDVYTITGNHSTDGTNTVASSNYTVGTTTKIYLKHGQTVTIGKNGNVKQIPVGTAYNITEVGATDYKTYIDGSTTDNKVMTQKTTVAEPVQPTYADPENLTAEEQTAKTAYETALATFNTQNKTSYVNNWEKDVLTGLFVNYWPFIILIGLGVIGIITIKKTTKEEY